MGKKDREDKEERRESFVDRQSRQKRKNMLIGIAVLAGIVAIIALVRIFGDKFDFSQQIYQVKSPYIHFEGEDGNTIHRHASNIKLGYLFDTIKVGLTNECFTFPDKKPEHNFCTNEDYSLKFYVNHEKVDGIRDYVLKDDDRILISYGNENQTAINAQLLELDGQLIKK
jgi:hypothetical protein